MDTNVFVEELKAKDTAVNLVKVYDDFKSILQQLLAKDRATFSLQVLCVLCRNLDSIPKWAGSIDNKTLLHLTIDCVRETRTMGRGDRMKTLACICRIHQHVIRQNTVIQPELVLKLSFMPFELEAKYLLDENSKLYWNLIIDRLAYMERLKAKTQIVKLLPKLTEDILKLIEIHEITQLCTSVIVFLIKKLHVLYNEQHPKELNDVYGQIFRKLSSKDANPLKKMIEKDTINVYTKLNDCLYVVAENASKINFKDTSLIPAVQTCIGLINHSPDLLHCFHTYHMTIINILTTDNISYAESMLNLLLSYLENEQSGCKTAMVATYPYINQLLRIFIEFNVNNSATRLWKDHFGIPMQAACLKVMLILMKCLGNCEQVLKCENCHVKSGLHDSLRLSFSVKHFISVSISEKILITDLMPILQAIIANQYEILHELKDLGCRNYEKFFKKLQTDIHNTAISLNKALYYEFSIKLFNIYIRQEINELNYTEPKNISRALFNKSICELNSKLYEDGLVDAFLSLMFRSENTEKYLSLVIDIKAKELASRGDDDDKNGLQKFSFMDACKKVLDEDLYGNVMPFLKDLKFSLLVCDEFQMYAKLWPAALPISGVWLALLKMAKGQYEFAVDNEAATFALHDVVVRTPAVVRAFKNEYFDSALTEILEEFDGRTLTPDEKILYASLLFLKAESELHAASLKYGWKTPAEMNQDPDQIPCNRTIPQEYVASKQAIRAVAILAELSPKFNTVTNRKWLHNSLKTYQVYVQQLLRLSRELEGLQLAYICCLIADCVGDDEAYVLNAGTLLYHCEPSAEVDAVLKIAGNKAKGLAVGTSVVFICNAAIYYGKCKEIGMAAKLVQIAQAKVLLSLERNPQLNLDMPIGRLLEAQLAICGTSDSLLADANNVHRHYLAIPGTGSTWQDRRLHSLTLRVHIVASSRVATVAARALRLWPRARAAAATLVAAANLATALTALSTDPSSLEHAQVIIDSRLKHMLGLQPWNDTQPCADSTESKIPPFTPKPGIETMLEHMVLKQAQTSPSIPSVPAFKMPSFYHHNKDCGCYACNIPNCLILACQICGLEASMYFRASENDIARNYFNGAMKMFHMTEERLKTMSCTRYDQFIVESTMKSDMDKLKTAKIHMLMELSFFEMKNGKNDAVNEHLVEIHEILNEINGDDYLKGEVANLTLCFAQLTKIKLVQTGLEAAFESLTLSPIKFTDPPKTPDAKPTKPPAPPTNIIVNNEELPKRRKVIKLNLDEVSDDEKDVKTTKKTKKTGFKVPVPVTKHNLEAATPVIKPRILITQPSMETPDNKSKIEFFTPHESTPDQFFTPMTSVKTYKKKSLRHNIVKNLQHEFSTPSASKEVNVTDDELDFVKEKSIKKEIRRIDKENKTQNAKDVKMTSKYFTDVKDRNDTAKAENTKALVTNYGTVTKRDGTASQKDRKVTKEITDTKKSALCLEVPSRSKSKDRLKRATSPGKLPKEQSETRPRRLKKPVIHDLK